MTPFWLKSPLARNREDSIIYKSLLRKHGISVISINEQVDETPAGKLLEGMIEVIDEFYSINLAQDTIRGLKENASRGYHNGGVPPIGYKARELKTALMRRPALSPMTYTLQSYSASSCYVSLVWAQRRS